MANSTGLIMRCLQALAGFYIMNKVVPMNGIFFAILLIYILFTPYYYISLLYFAYMYLDRHTPSRGGRGFHIWRNLFIFKWFADYFPMKLVKTHDLDPGKNYFFICHPHGLLSLSFVGHFALQRTGFATMFKGLFVRFVSLDIQFWFPIHREFALAMGVIAANRQSIEWCLSGKEGNKGGQVVALVVGGGREVLAAHPNTMNLCLKNRKGFVKIALTTGTSLVPVLSFGENEVFEQKAFAPNSRFRRYQEWMLKTFGCTQPVPKSLLPIRHPITTVVGKPIPVAKVDNPSAEQINELHDRYIDSLRQLFNENKDKYGSKNLKLTII
ncbi:unnamed protein product [Medioppia subpectinata]|uniref:Acyltransferase n=1 Tax=Medioppia subpectinata TaxID=1979941 RepID=A0A7R9Q2B1_9ACAR|nr:unnamed protein product [Medioppia subpectinata]CAG2110110.1 unnamed protein product [Medioppia subpectinata]